MWLVHLQEQLSWGWDRKIISSLLKLKKKNSLNSSSIVLSHLHSIDHPTPEFNRFLVPELQCDFVSPNLCSLLSETLFVACLRRKCNLPRQRTYSTLGKAFNKFREITKLNTSNRECIRVFHIKIHKWHDKESEILKAAFWEWNLVKDRIKCK